MGTEGANLGAAQGDGTVGKACAVLDLVASFERPVKFSELLAAAQFPKATLYRFLQTLVNQGMLHYDPDFQTYGLGVRLVRLAHAAWRHSSIAPIARPMIDELSRDVGETVHLAQLDNAQVLYVDKRNATTPVQMFSDAGKVGPAYCTGVGKAMLAHLSESELERALAQQSFHRFTPSTIVDAPSMRAELAEIRSAGFSLDREEHEPGIICVAVPILTENGRALGAVSVTGTVARTSLEALVDLVPRMVVTAGQISAAARTWRFPEGNAHLEGEG